MRMPKERNSETGGVEEISTDLSDPSSLSMTSISGASLKSTQQLVAK